MDKNQAYYRKLDLRRLAESVPPDTETRRKAAAFHDMLKALALRFEAESITSEDLLAYAGKPDRIEKTKDGDVWEYSWIGEHCSHEYLSSTPFIIGDGRVIGIRRQELTRAS